MPNQWDLTGENIENTYQRVLQTPDGVNIFDGTGSAFTVTAVAAPAGPDQSIQFRDGSTTSGSGNFTFNKATNTVNLTGSLSTRYITFDTITAITPALAQINWNQTDKTLEFSYGDGDTTLQIGQEAVYPPVVNKDTINLVEGTLVMVDPTQVAQGNRVRIVRAVTDGTYPSQLLLGILTEDINKNQEGHVTWFGYVRNLNIPTLEANGIKPVGETWIEGNILYPNPSSPGGLTNVMPASPAIKSTIAAITSINGVNLTLLVRPTFTFKLNELNDINATSAVAGDLLVKDGNVWNSSKQLTGSYGLTGSLNITGDSGSIVDVSSSNAALHVTQRGTGDAIIVEDSANPDTTPFVVAADGRVGIGVQAPLSTYKLHVRNGTVTNSVTWGGSVGVFENSGSNAYLSVLSSDTYTSGIGFGSAAHRVSANLNWNSTTKDFNLATNTASAFLTFGTDSGTERMRITSGGFVGINTTSPQYRLDVSGSSRITGDLIVTGTIDGGTF